MKILVLHGANLNMLGKRDVLHYGTLTLAELNKLVAEYAESKGIKTEFYQSNYEGDLIDILQRTE
ncbi:MAG: type II 3-dehydroquinate dehydratase, partial [Clostridia bacterium]